MPLYDYRGTPDPRNPYTLPGSRLAAIVGCRVKTLHNMAKREVFDYQYERRRYMFHERYADQKTLYDLPLLSTRDVAKIFDVSPKTVQTWNASGLIAAVPCNYLYRRFSRATVDRLILSGRRRPEKPPPWWGEAARRDWWLRRNAHASPAPDRERS